MREIVRQSAFKREKKGKHRATLDDRLRDVLAFLVRDVALPTSFKDHTMGGKWHDCRNCHIKPDLVLLYRKTDDDELDLVRLGSHSELGI